jgi:hypothetical protein
MNSIPFSFDVPLAKPTDELPHSYEHTTLDVSHPPQTADGEEFICGNTGNAHPYANPGRDQDRSRMDERIAAQGCARYVS